MGKIFGRTTYIINVERGMKREAVFILGSYFIPAKAGKGCITVSGASRINCIEMLRDSGVWAW